MKRFTKRSIAVFLSLLISFGALSLTSAAATPDEATVAETEAAPTDAELAEVGVTEAESAEVGASDGSVITVTKQDAGSGFLWAVQSALNTARDKATDSNPYTVVAPAGKYSLSGVLRMYNNTTLDLRGVTLTRSGGGNMLRVGSEDSVNSGAEGYVYRNIRVIGGTFDGNAGSNTMIKAFHTKNFTMEDVTVKNEKEGHMMEFAGVDGLTLRGCTVKDQLLSKGNFGYEAIQLDVLHPFHITNGRCEDLPITNVLIENCTFSNLPRAIGSHTAVHNRPHNNITIRRNTFKDMGSIAIQGMGWTNVSITSNYIENAPRGITVLSEPYGCTYLSSKLASKGGTKSHASDSYQTPSKANINIAYNTLKKIGTTDDKYASYSSQGIAVLGEKLKSKSPVDGSDESGGLPAGDYYLSGVNIHDNYIDIRGNGVRVEDARDVKVEYNEILCSKNTVHSDNYYGIVLRSNVSASSVSYNTIKNAEVNGIQIDGGDGGKFELVQYNRIEKTGKYGIGAYDATIGNIYDNDIMNTPNIGLFAADCSVNQIKWNRIRNISNSGIWLTSGTKASLVESNTTVKCSGNNSYGKSTVKSNYTSSSALTSYHIPWYWKTARKGAEMGVGTAFKIVPDVRPTNALTSFSYTSSDSSVASVDSCGMVFALKEGKTTVKVTSENGISMSYTVTVKGDGGVTHLEKAPSAPVLILGDADGNGTVEAMDTVFVQRSLAYMETPYSIYTLLHADVDKSGSLELTDVTYIQRYLANLKTPYKIGKSY